MKTRRPRVSLRAIDDFGREPETRSTRRAAAKFRIVLRNRRLPFRLGSDNGRLEALTP